MSRLEMVSGRFLFFLLFAGPMTLWAAPEQSQRLWTVSTQPLGYFSHSLPLGVEYRVTEPISVGIDLHPMLEYVPPWNKLSGWRWSVTTDFYAKYHISNQVPDQGFYLMLLLGLGYTNKPSAIQTYALGYFARSGLYRIPLRLDFISRENFINVAPGLAVGHNWLFNSGLNVDLGIGVKATTLFAVGDGGGYFFTLPIPFIRLALGQAF